MSAIGPSLPLSTGYGNAPFPGRSDEFIEWQLDALLYVLPFAFNKGQVLLFHRFLRVFVCEAQQAPRVF